MDFFTAPVVQIRFARKKRKETGQTEHRVVQLFQDIHLAPRHLVAQLLRNGAQHILGVATFYAVFAS